jgi:hypothetical protein
MKIKDKKIDDLNRELTIEVAAEDYAEIEKKNSPSAAGRRSSRASARAWCPHP